MLNVKTFVFLSAHKEMEMEFLNEAETGKTP